MSPIRHEAAVPECPRNVRYCSKTGSDVLIESLTAFDPSDTSPAKFAVMHKVLLIRTV